MTITVYKFQCSCGFESFKAISALDTLTPIKCPYCDTLLEIQKPNMVQCLHETRDTEDIIPPIHNQETQE